MTTTTTNILAQLISDHVDILADVLVQASFHTVFAPGAPATLDSAQDLDKETFAGLQWLRVLTLTGRMVHDEGAEVEFLYVDAAPVWKYQGVTDRSPSYVSFLSIIHAVEYAIKFADETNVLHAINTIEALLKAHAQAQEVDRKHRELVELVGAAYAATVVGGAA
jgi:hypothetical protein